MEAIAPHLSPSDGAIPLTNRGGDCAAVTLSGDGPGHREGRGQEEGLQGLVSRKTSKAGPVFGGGTVARPIGVGGWTPPIGIDTVPPP